MTEVHVCEQLAQVVTRQWKPKQPAKSYIGNNWGRSFLKLATFGVCSAL